MRNLTEVRQYVISHLFLAYARLALDSLTLVKAILAQARLIFFLLKTKIRQLAVAIATTY